MCAKPTRRSALPCSCLAVHAVVPPPGAAYCKRCQQLGLTNLLPRQQAQRAGEEHVSSHTFQCACVGVSKAALCCDSLGDRQAADQRLFFFIASSSLGLYHLMLQDRLIKYSYLFLVLYKLSKKKSFYLQPS